MSGIAQPPPHLSIKFTTATTRSRLLRFFTCVIFFKHNYSWTSSQINRHTRGAIEIRSIFLQLMRLSIANYRNDEIFLF